MIQMYRGILINYFIHVRRSLIIEMHSTISERATVIQNKIHTRVATQLCGLSTLRCDSLLVNYSTVSMN